MSDYQQAHSAVGYAARELAAALEALDRCDQRIEDARAAALEAVQIKVRCLDDVDRRQTELVAAETELARHAATIAQTNGSASGSAYNPTIRIDQPD